jgi:hypothetical protein
MATWFGPLRDQKDLASDGLHVNEAGGAKIAAQLEAEIAKAQTAAAAPADPLTIRGSAPPPWKDLKSSPRFWLAADGLVSLDAKGRVANCADASGAPTRRGTPAEARQPLPGARPQFVPDVINDKPAIRFDGKSNFLYADFLDNGATTYVFVLRAANTDGALLGHANAAIPSPDILHGFAGDLWINGRKQAGPAAVPAGQPVIVTATPSGVTPAFLLGLQQSASNEAVTDRHFAGDIAEVLAFYPGLDDASRMVVETALGKKYGIPIAQ